MTTIRTLMSWLDRRYPPSLAEDWDRVGLIVGDPEAPVTTVLFTVDVTDEVVAEAVQKGAELIVAHHPLLLRGVTAVRRDQPKGRLVMSLVEAGIAVFAAHTNADSAVDGVSDAVAAVLGLQDVRPLLSGGGERLDKLVAFVPEDHADAVRAALAEAGAGAMGPYDSCSFSSPGTGRFRPLPEANPFIGTAGGEVETVDEVRVEVVLQRSRRADVLKTLREAHPYETPAFDLIELAGTDDVREGLGRVGSLPAELPLRAVAELLAGALPQTATGIRVGGDPNRAVRTVAVLAGAGDSLLEDARRAGVDVYATSDLRHHPASEFLEWTGGPGLIDIPHWAAEWMWLPEAERALREDAAAAGVALETSLCRINTDPWSLRI